MQFSQFNNPRLMFRGFDGSLFCGNSSAASNSTSATNTYTDNSDHRQDNRQDNSTSNVTTVTDNSDNRVDARQDNSTAIHDAFNTTNVNASDNRQDNRQDNSSVVTTTSTVTNNQDQRQDNRQDNSVTNVTYNSLDADLIRNANDNAARTALAQSSALAASFQAFSNDALGITSAALNSNNAANGNLTSIAGAALSGFERVNSASLLANGDVTRDALSFATGASSSALSLAKDALTNALNMGADQTAKDLNFASSFLGDLFASQKSEATQNTQQIIDGLKVVGVVGILAYAATKLGKKAA